jgi:hypothetical protein
MLSASLHSRRYYGNVSVASRGQEIVSYTCICVQLDDTLILLFYLKVSTCFGHSLPIIRRSYTAWSAVIYGKRKCGRGGGGWGFVFYLSVG